jgi:hypothetical protein
MSTIEHYEQGFQKYVDRTQEHAAFITTDVRGCKSPNIRNLADLARITLSNIPYHLAYRNEISGDENLPEIVRNDPPSLRSTLWLRMVRGIVDQVPHNLSKSSTTSYEDIEFIYALYRCWANGFDDVMDSKVVPIEKKDTMCNPGLNDITASMGERLLTCYRQEDESGKKRVRGFTRELRMLRDHWRGQVNKFEGENLTFDKALIYNAETMGPLTYVFTRLVSLDMSLGGEFEQNLDRALTAYAMAGKIIDDITDWPKDLKNGTVVNMLDLALQESGEREKTIRATERIRRKAGDKFVPVTKLRAIAPEAIGRCYETIDNNIAKLEELPFTELTTSMKAVRNAMWAYALNEGVARV